MSNFDPVATADTSRHNSSLPVPVSSVKIDWGVNPLPSVSHVVLVQLPSTTLIGSTARWRR